MTILRTALLAVRAARAWAQAFDEAHHQFRTVYAITTHTPI